MCLPSIIEMFFFFLCEINDRINPYVTVIRYCVLEYLNMLHEHITTHVVTWKHFFRITSYSKAKASELLEDLEEVFVSLLTGDVNNELHQICHQNLLSLKG